MVDRRTRKVDVQPGFVRVTQPITWEDQEQGQVSVFMLEPNTLITEALLLVTEPFVGSGEPPVLTMGDADTLSGYIAQGDVDPRKIGVYRGGRSAEYHAGKYYPEPARFYVTLQPRGRLTAGCCYGVFYCTPFIGVI
jgi:hypothetical protein